MKFLEHTPHMLDTDRALLQRDAGGDTRGSDISSSAFVYRRKHCVYSAHIEQTVAFISTQPTLFDRGCFPRAPAAAPRKSIRLAGNGTSLPLAGAEVISNNSRLDLNIRLRKIAQ
ncbi:hypothetical protein Aduo_018014 [Ancylostoma duodenale]